MKKKKKKYKYNKMFRGKGLGRHREDRGSTSRGWGGRCKDNLLGVRAFRGNRRSHIVQIYHHYVIDLLGKLSHTGAILPSLLFLFSSVAGRPPI